MDADVIISNIEKIYKNQLHDEVTKTLKKEMHYYGEELESEIRNEWDSYLNSYSPKLYQRTGRTMASIKYIGLTGDIEYGMEALVKYGSNAMDTYTNSYRIPFQAIDEGWEHKSKTKGEKRIKRYHYYGGRPMTENIKSNVERILPSYITLEMG